MHISLLWMGGLVRRECGEQRPFHPDSWYSGQPSKGLLLLIVRLSA
jgi:hypothetical protein